MKWLERIARTLIGVGTTVIVAAGEYALFDDSGVSTIDAVVLNGSLLLALGVFLGIVSAGK